MAVEPFDEGKASFMNELEKLRPDLMYADIWSEGDREWAVEQFRPAKVKSGMLSSIPMRCRAEKCQPAGSMVRTVSHGEVPIEDLDPEVHHLITYDLNSHFIRKGRPNFGYPGYSFKKAKSEYKGMMYTLYTGDSVQRITSGHITIARWSEKADAAFAVYLMERNGLFRIGMTKLMHNYDGRQDFGPGRRAKDEDAHNLWVLDVYQSKTEALLNEEKFSVQWGIPKACFIAHPNEKRKYQGLYRWVTQEQLNAHHLSMQKSIVHYAELLESIGRNINYPIWSRDNHDCQIYEHGNRTKTFSRLGGHNILLLRASNMFSEYMTVPTLPGEQIWRNYKKKDGSQGVKKCGIKPRWTEVKVSYDYYDGYVYSLDVEKHNTYISDGIATHNCFVADMCPLVKRGIAPEGKPCPIEQSLVLQFFNDYVEELNVDTDRMVEVSMVRDLVDQEIQQMRKTWLLSQEHFIQENVAGVDSEGNVVLKKELHQAIDYEERILKRKEKLRNALLATRESKAKSGQATMDNAQLMAQLMADARQVELDSQEGKEYSYIEDAEIVEDEG